MNVTPLAAAATALGPVPLPEYAVRAAARRAATATAAAEVMLSETAITAAAAATAKGNAFTTVATDFIVDESVLFTDGELSAYADVNVDELMGEAFAMSPNAIALAVAQANKTEMEVEVEVITATTIPTTATTTPTTITTKIGRVQTTGTTIARPKRKRNRKTEAQVKKERKERVASLYEQNKAGRDALAVVVPGLQELMPYIKLLAAKWGI